MLGVFVDSKPISSWLCKIALQNFTPRNHLSQSENICVQCHQRHIVSIKTDQTCYIFYRKTFKLIIPRHLNDVKI